MSAFRLIASASPPASDVGGTPGQHLCLTRSWLSPSLVTLRRMRSGMSRGAGIVEECVQRRLVAILAADVVGYSRLMGED